MHSITPGDGQHWVMSSSEYSCGHKRECRLPLPQVGFLQECTGACPSLSLALYLANFDYLLWSMHSFIKGMCVVLIVQGELWTKGLLWRYLVLTWGSIRCVRKLVASVLRLSQRSTVELHVEYWITFFFNKEFVTMMYTFLVLSANLLQQQQKMHRVIFIVFLSFFFLFREI